MSIQKTARMTESKLLGRREPPFEFKRAGKKKKKLWIRNPKVARGVPARKRRDNNNIKG